MAHASDAHGSILAELVYLLSAHLDAQGRRYRIVVTSGVIRRVRSAENCRIPDIGITCAPPSGAKTLADPVVLIEILSPSNEAETRANVWAYTTIPTVAEIVVLRSTSVQAEVLRRQPGGSWPEQPEIVRDAVELRLESIGFAEPLRLAYRTFGGQLDLNMKDVQRTRRGRSRSAMSQSSLQQEWPLISTGALRNC